MIPFSLQFDKSHFKWAPGKEKPKGDFVTEKGFGIWYHKATISDKEDFKCLP